MNMIQGLSKLSDFHICLFFASFCPLVIVLYTTYSSQFLACSTLATVFCLLCTFQMDFHPFPNMNYPRKTVLSTAPCYPLAHAGLTACN